MASVLDLELLSLIIQSNGVKKRKRGSFVKPFAQINQERSINLFPESFLSLKIKENGLKKSQKNGRIQEKMKITYVGRLLKNNQFVPISGNKSQLIKKKEKINSQQIEVKFKGMIPEVEILGGEELDIGNLLKKFALVFTQLYDENEKNTSEIIEDFIEKYGNFEEKSLKNTMKIMVDVDEKNSTEGQKIQVKLQDDRIELTVTSYIETYPTDVETKTIKETPLICQITKEKIPIYVLPSKTPDINQNRKKEKEQVKVFIKRAGINQNVRMVQHQIQVYQTNLKDQKCKRINLIYLHENNQNSEEKQVVTYLREQNAYHYLRKALEEKDEDYFYKVFWILREGILAALELTKHQIAHRDYFLWNILVDKERNPHCYIADLAEFCYLDSNKNQARIRKFTENFTFSQLEQFKERTEWESEKLNLENQAQMFKQIKYDIFTLLKSFEEDIEINFVQKFIINTKENKILKPNKATNFVISKKSDFYAFEVLKILFERKEQIAQNRQFTVQKLLQIVEQVLKFYDD